MNQLLRLPPVRAIASSIARTDYVRRSMWGRGGRPGHREWFHFCVSEPGLTVLVNFNVADDTRAPLTPGRQTGRVVVLVNEAGTWSGDVEEVPSERIQLAGGRIFLALADSRLEFDEGTFRLRARLPRELLELDVVLEPATFPSLANNVALAASEAPINWLVVPRLKASGHLRRAGRERTLSGAWAYHDHNWGFFSHRDFAWQWGHALSDDSSRPFAVVFSRLTNRAQSDVFMQALLLWRGPQQYRVLREAELTVEAVGRSAAKPFTVPRVANLLVSGTATEVPEHFVVRARGGGDDVTARFDAQHVARILVPHDHDLGTTVINEAVGRLTLEGHVRGEIVSFEGRGVFEFLGSGA